MKYFVLVITLSYIIKLGTANRIEIAENYIQKLKSASSVDEAEELIRNIIKVLSPFAELNPDFNKLRSAADKLVEQEKLKEVDTFRNIGSGVSEGQKKRINYSAFIEVFKIFKFNFKYESVIDYNLKSDEL